MLSINGLYMHDPTIFDYFYLPTALADEKQNIIDYICESCAELEIVYPDPNIMKNSIRIWSSRNLLRWQKLYETTQFEYNPIWNKDGTVEESYYDNSVSNTEAVTQKTGYNDDQFADNERNTANGNANNNGTRIRSEAGNIGVTTTQTMIKEEREVWNFNIYDVILNDFRKYYCLMVW